MSSKAGDPYILNVQKWINDTFGSDSRFTEIAEDGYIGWGTINGLIKGLQISLGLATLANNFGQGTINAWNNYVATNGNIEEQSEDTTNETRKKINGIIQGALICKGYDIGSAAPTEQFHEKTGNAVKRLKKDMGLSDTTTIVTLNIIKALLTMDYFTSYSTSARVQAIVQMQRYLNGNYEEYIGIRPCDGVVGRSTSLALIMAIQAEEMVPKSQVDGIVGPTTKKCLPPLPYEGGYTHNNQTYGLSYTGKKYSDESIEKFVKLANIGLYFNGYGDGTVNSPITQEVIQAFQYMYALPMTGKIDLTTWLSMIISCGNTERTAKGCDCASIIDGTKMGALFTNGYKYIGRYISGTILGPNGTQISKALSKTEMDLLFANSMGIFPIYQGSANNASYFTIAQAKKDGENAANHAQNLNLSLGTILYFAVDFDAIDTQVTNLIIPYFKQLYSTFMEKCEGKYRVGIYGTRNVCTRVCNAGYACSSFVSDMSTGYSGNLGYPIPENWALDQFANTKISYQGESFEIDKDAVSGRYSGMSNFLYLPPATLDEAKDEHSSNMRYCSLIVVNRGASIPVYEDKIPRHDPLPSSGYMVSGKIIKYIEYNDAYVFFNVTDPGTDNIHLVLYNNGKGELCTGYVEGKYLLEVPVDNRGYIKYLDANKNQLPDAQEAFSCIKYNYSNGEYSKENWNMLHTFKINKPVPYYTEDGSYLGLLEKDDEISITADNYNNSGTTKPWCYKVSEVKRKNNVINDSAVYVSIGLEWGSKGRDRAWIN